MKLKLSVCPICRTKNNLKYINQYKQWSLYECQNCLIQFWMPLEHPGREFYEIEEDYQILGPEKLSWIHKCFLRNPPLREGKLLDVGCGYGTFLNSAKNLGFEVWGIDISESLIRAAKKFYHLENIFPLTLDKFIVNYKPPLFDVITLFEVFEHLTNPHEIICLIKKILKKNGYLVLTVPNLERFGNRKELWDMPPHHFFRWRYKTLKDFLNREGFSIVDFKIQPLPLNFFYLKGYSSFGIVGVLNQKMGITSGSVKKCPRSIYHLILRLAKIKNQIFTAITMPIALVLRLSGLKYGSLYVLAKRN